MFTFLVNFAKHETCQTCGVLTSTTLQDMVYCYLFKIIYVHTTYTCTHHLYLHTPPLLAHTTSTCTHHLYLHRPPRLAHTTSTCTHHLYLHTPPLLAHITSTCTHHLYLHTPPLLAHTTSTCTHHLYLHTPPLLAHTTSTCTQQRLFSGYIATQSQCSRSINNIDPLACLCGYRLYITRHYYYYYYYYRMNTFLTTCLLPPGLTLLNADFTKRVLHVDEH